MSVPVPTPTDPRRPPTAFQVFWTSVCWTGFGVSVLLFLSGTAAVIADPEGFFVGWGSLALGVVASFSAALLMTRLVQIRASDLWFALGTTAARVIGAGWVLIGIGMIVGTIIAVAIDLDTDIVVGPVVGVIGTLGGVALVAMIGPGYTEYREARHLTLDTEFAAEARRLARVRRRARRMPVPPAG